MTPEEKVPEKREITAQITGLYNLQDTGSVRVIVQLEEGGYHWEKIYDFHQTAVIEFDAVMDRAIEDVKRDLQKDSPARKLIPRIGEKVKFNI